MNKLTDEISALITYVHDGLVDKKFQYGVVELPNDIRKVEEIKAQKSSGKNAEMAFTYINPEISGEPNKFDWAKSAIVVAFNYMGDVSYQLSSEPGLSRIASFSVKDYYQPLQKEVEKIMMELRSLGYKAESFVDNSYHYDRLFFTSAGLGWQGKSTMMLSPGIGPWQLLGTIYTSKKLRGNTETSQTCGDCNFCQISCPTGALDTDYILDANLCISYWLQSPKIIPRDMRIFVGNRFYGCDECLTSCPPGQNEIKNGSTHNSIDIISVLKKTDQELLDEFKRFYIPNMDPSHLRRNGLISLANNPSTDATSVFKKYLYNDNPELVMYSIWCLWRVSRVDLLLELSKNLDTGDKIIREEIDWVLSMPS